MKLYNIEIFSAEYEYKSSYQLDNVGYEMDYLSPDSSTLRIPKITADKGDYIRITGTGEHTGIVTSCKDTGKEYELKTKPLLSLLDIDVHFNRERLKTISLEEWLAEIINDTFKSNADTLQNIPGLVAIATTKTMGAIIDAEENIGNLYDIITKALINYGIVIGFEIDINGKRLIADIHTVSAAAQTIEADLPNVIQKEFVKNQAEGAVNKITIYNELNEGEYISYYMLDDGSITNNSAAKGRITPVIFDTVYISREMENEETFVEMAYEKAFNTLISEKYNNLIELTVLANDTIVHPETMEIGQKVKIIRGDKEYETVLTGKNIKNKEIKLMFGAVRLELTKKLKRRIIK